VNIKVKCKNCKWEGQALVALVKKSGFQLDDYKCTEYGQDVKRGKGNYDYFSEVTKLK